MTKKTPHSTPRPRDLSRQEVLARLVKMVPEGVHVSVDLSLNRHSAGDYRTTKRIYIADPVIFTDPYLTTWREALEDAKTKLAAATK